MTSEAGVKPLEWVASGTRCWRAKSIIGYYRAMEYRAPNLPAAGWESPDQWPHDADSVDAAKAAAQADYEARVRSALVAPDAALSEEGR